MNRVDPVEMFERIGDQPDGLIDGMLERDAEVAFDNLKRRWGFDEALNRIAEIILKAAHEKPWGRNQ